MLTKGTRYKIKEGYGASVDGFKVGDIIIPTENDTFAWCVPEKDYIPEKAPDEYGVNIIPFYGREVGMLPICEGEVTEVTENG